MPDETQTPTQTLQTQTPQTQTPQEYFYSLPNVPSPAQVAAMKSQVPNGVIRMFTPDNKRFFLLRGLSGLEMKKVQEAVPQNSSDPETDFKLSAVAMTCVWTNLTPNGKLDESTLRASTAGLPQTLWSTVEMLSDFFAPTQILNMSIDL